MVTWNGWKVIRLIGRGASARVYELEKDGGFRSALKVITIPQDQSEVEELSSQGMDSKSISEYYSAEIDSVVEEFKLMYALRGQTNFVSYEDHEIRRNEDGVGGIIYIRMELLRSLQEVMSQRILTEEEVIKVGIDLCRALDVCEKRHILHRDIKPQNIFVNESGDYKLGDFGIARTLERTTLNISRKGTYSYMAPEIYKGEPYGHRSDIYSLGIVLYQLLNNNRLPFLPEGMITPSDREAAFADRISGVNMPAPAHGSPKLVSVILKAAAYAPEDRYRSAGEMLNQLRQCLQALLWEEEEKTVSILNKTGKTTLAANTEPGLPRYEGRSNGENRENEIKRGTPYPERSSYTERPPYKGKSSYIGRTPDPPETTDHRKKIAAAVLAGAIVAIILFIIGTRSGRKPVKDPDDYRAEATTEKITEPETVSTTQRTTKATTASTTQKTTKAATVSTTRKETPSDPVVWTDSNLEAAVKKYLNHKGDLTIGEAAKVKKLECNKSGITDISSLKYFTGLEELYVTDNQIAKIPKEILNLRKLYKLHLESNSISDITPLANMTWLKRLDLCDNMVTDLSPISNLTGLTMLDIRKNKVSDISPLKNMKDMGELYISTNRLTDITPIAGMVKLTYLSISYNTIRDISCLKNMKNLGVLTMTENDIHDISVLRNLTKIYHLKIRNNPIEDYSPLEVFSDKVYIDYLDDK